MSDTAIQLRNIARVLRKGFAGHLAFDSAECQGMAKSLATAADELDRAQHILAALREPSEGVRNSILDAYYSSWNSRDIWTVVIHAAVAAAEQEVGR